MIRFLRAFLWLRWRLFVNSLKGGSDTTAKLARWAQAIAKVVLPLLFIPGALGLGFVAYLGGRYLGSAGSDPQWVVIPARIVMGLITFIVVLAPLIRAAHGSTSGRSRLMLLPIPRGALHLCETAAGLADPWMFIAIPAVFLLPLGWYLNGGGAASILALIAGVTLLATLTALSSLAAFTAHLLFRNRRRAEMASLLVLTVITMASFIPAFMEMRREDTARELGQPEINEPAVARFVPLLRPLPSELYGRILDRGVDGNLAGAVAPLILLALIGGGLFTVSSRVYRRLLETPEMTSSRRSAGEALALGTRSLPGLSSPTAAVAWACVRTALRTVKGKMAVYTNPLFVAFFCLLLSREFEGIELAGLRLGAGALGALISVTFPMLSLQPVLLNFFAVDRAGLTLEFLAPVSDQQMVRGKVAGGAILTLGSWMMCLAAAALVTREGPIALWLLTALGGVAGYLIVGPTFAILSAVLPKAADLGSMGSRGNPNQFAALLSFPLMPVALGPIVVLGLAGQVMFGSLMAGVALMAVWTAVAAGISMALLHLGAGILGKRRENLALVAQGR